MELRLASKYVTAPLFQHFKKPDKNKEVQERSPEEPPVAQGVFFVLFFRLNVQSIKQKKLSYVNRE